MPMTFRRLLLSTALTLPAMAGTAYAQDSEAPCEQLSSMIEDGVPQDVSMSEDELQQLVQDGDAEACATQLEQMQSSDSEQASAEADAEAEAEAEAPGPAPVVAMLATDAPGTPPGP